MVLFYKNAKVQYALSYVLGTKPLKGYDIDPDSCSYDFLYIHFIIAILIVVSIYSAIKLSMKIYRHLRVYNTILYFRHKHRLRHGRQLSISLELSTFSNGIVVRIASIKSPIALLSTDYTIAFPEFSLDNNAVLNTKLVLTRPIFLKHVDCSAIITISTRFKLSIYQAYINYVI